MANIKHTNTELKTQIEALNRFERFLPMLQLKKQQLQMEIQNINDALKKIRSKKHLILENIKSWIKLFAEPVDINSLIKFEAIILEEGNIAGVNIPIYKDTQIKVNKEKAIHAPPWVDDAIIALTELMQIESQLLVYEKQKTLIEQELRVTSQRVNLFEKIKIPECKENIRIIRIFLGDEQTASVARSKTAKKKLLMDTQQQRGQAA